MNRKSSVIVLLLLAATLAAAQQGVPAELSGLKKIFVRSETVYLKAEHLQRSLRANPSFTTWGMELVLDPKDADAILQVNRPFLTFDWTYKLLEARSGRELVSGIVTASEGRRAADRVADALLGAVAPAKAPDKRTPAEILASFRTLYVESHTIYLKTEQLIAALQAQPGMSGWGIKLVAVPEDAEVTVRVDRPFMTFDWTYTLQHPASGKHLGGGRIVAGDGPSAAPLLAASIMSEVGKARAAK